MIKTFVFDTNSLVSANLLPASVSREALDKAREAGILVYSDSTLSEFVGVFLLPKFDKYLSLPKRLNAISTFEKLSQHIEVSVKVNICRDSKDNMIPELAIETFASCIITGDQDLLVLNPFENIPILTAGEFLASF